MHDRSILLVEDDPDVREAVAAVLHSGGHHVVEARDGREALSLLRGSSRFCLIVLDLFMPEMNGWEFRVEQMKDPELSTIPVLVMSADANAAKRADTPGVVAVLTKPLEIGRLLEVVEHHC